MSRIRRLEETLVRQIAAGEVVERPASVLKELIENALDAGAGQIDVTLEDGGKRRVEVADDGSGMDRDDLLLALERHATSKIGSFDDLMAIDTLGFRGEALAAIASVSEIELASAVTMGEANALYVRGGRVERVERLSRRRGTTVAVRFLFENVPARRKFLKTTPTELRRCLEVVQGYALAFPEVGFRVVHDGRELLAAPRLEGGPEEAVTERLHQLYERRFQGEVEKLGPASLPAGGRVFGLMGSPATSRSRKSMVFVNRRLVRDRAVLAVFYRAVRDVWKSERFPSLFLFLELPPDAVDVNVHPQKSEVRFREPATIGALSRAMRRTLEQIRGEPEPVLREAAQEIRDPGLRSAERGPSWTLSTAGEAGAAYPGAASASAAQLPQIRYREEQQRARLSGRPERARALRILGQYKGSIVLLEGPEALYLVDQHVAHERVLYERFRSALRSTAAPSQRLLQPLILRLSAEERASLVGLSEPLESCGFSLRELSDDTLALAACPPFFAIEEAEGFLRALGEAGDEEPGREEIEEAMLAALAAGLSCRHAVKMHHPLSMPEIEGLVDDLLACEAPELCPHGRPVMLKIADADLEQRFGRRG